VREVFQKDGEKKVGREKGRKGKGGREEGRKGGRVRRQGGGGKGRGKRTDAKEGEVTW
jgi:hypothetical protein